MESEPTAVNIGLTLTTKNLKTNQQAQSSVESDSAGAAWKATKATSVYTPKFGAKNWNQNDHPP